MDETNRLQFVGRRPEIGKRKATHQGRVRRLDSALSDVLIVRIGH